MNTLNLLGPALLICALGIAFCAYWGDFSETEQQWLNQAAFYLAIIAVLIRFIWGLGIRRLARRKKRPILQKP